MNKDEPSTGPVFAIYHGKDEDLHLFSEVEQNLFFGVDCISGKALRVGKDDWREGLTIHLPVANIVRIIEYKSLSEYKKVVADHYTKKAET
jgi:hypothetical protein